MDAERPSTFDQPHGEDVLVRPRGDEHVEGREDGPGEVLRAVVAQQVVEPAVRVEGRVPQAALP